MGLKPLLSPLNLHGHGTNQRLALKDTPVDLIATAWCPPLFRDQGIQTVAAPEVLTPKKRKQRGKLLAPPQDLPPNFRMRDIACYFSQIEGGVPVAQHPIASTYMCNRHPPLPQLSQEELAKSPKFVQFHYKQALSRRTLDVDSLSTSFSDTEEEKEARDLDAIIAQEARLAKELSATAGAGAATGEAVGEAAVAEEENWD